jgi:predicted  nucleic acid-binding Zn-ribbon protein
LVDRITGRFTCANCGESYHDRYRLPKSTGTCDICRSTTFKRRRDDNELTVRTRMAEYRAKTAPILPGYEQRGIVRRGRWDAADRDGNSSNRHDPSTIGSTCLAWLPFYSEHGHSVRSYFFNHKPVC